MQVHLGANFFWCIWWHTRADLLLRSVTKVLCFGHPGACRKLARFWHYFRSRCARGGGLGSNVWWPTVLPTVLKYYRQCGRLVAEIQVARVWQWWPRQLDLFASFGWQRFLLCGVNYQPFLSDKDVFTCIAVIDKRYQKIALFLSEWCSCLSNKLTGYQRYAQLSEV